MGGEGAKSKELTGKEHSATRTGKAISLANVTHILNAAEGKVEHGDLNEAGKGCGDDLGCEHGPWRDLHIMLPRDSVLDMLSCAFFLFSPRVEQKRGETHTPNLRSATKLRA